MSSWNTKRNDPNGEKAEKNHCHILVLNKSEQKKEHQIQNGNLNHKPAIVIDNWISKEVTYYHLNWCLNLVIEQAHQNIDDIAHPEWN